jgi:hypothetical protein
MDDPRPAPPSAPGLVEALERYAKVGRMITQGLASPAAFDWRVFSPTLEIAAAALRAAEQREVPLTEEPLVEALAAMRRDHAALRAAEQREPDGWTTQERVAFAARVLDDHGMLEEAERLRAIYAAPAAESEG